MEDIAVLETPQELEDAIQQSRFFMIRSLIAIAHIDKIMHPFEEIYLWALINHLEFNAEQIDRIKRAFREPEDLSLLVPKIVKDKKKLQLLYFAKILVFKDQALHIDEIDVLEKLHLYFSNSFDMREINTKTEQFLKKHNYMKISSGLGIDRAGYTVPWFQLFDEFMKDIGLDLLK